MVIGYLGPKHSFTYQATDTLFPQEIKQPYPTIPTVIEAVIKNEVDYAVVPIENSLEGSVHASMDKLFQTSGLSICKEVIMSIQQQLMMNIEQRQPKKIMSHPQALAQAQFFLEKNYPTVPLIAAPSTTYAAEYVAKHPEEEMAAIASKKAAEAFHLTVIHEGIQDNEQNQTRFWLLSRSADTRRIGEVDKVEKLTLFCTLPANQPGALHKLLAVFAWRGIDLAKIESRPLKTSLGQYYFMIDLAVSDNLALINYAIEEISLLGIEVKQLGSYSVTDIK